MAENCTTQANSKFELEKKMKSHMCIQMVSELQQHGQGTAQKQADSSLLQ